MTAVLPARAAAPQRRPAAPGRRPSPGRHLAPVERPRPRRSPAVPALVGAGMVIAALLALAVMHALLIGGQVRLDGLRADAAAETEAIRRLELRVAELESPDRVLAVARDRLGMVQPAEVGYLLPVGVPGAPADPVRVAAAEAPAPPPAEIEEGAEDGAPAVSREQAEVERAVEDGTAGDGTAGDGTVEDGTVDGVVAAAADAEGGRDG